MLNLVVGKETARLYKVNPLKTNGRLLYLKAQSVPRCKHFISVIKTSQFMLYEAEDAVCSEINIEQTQRGQDVNS